MEKSYLLEIAKEAIESKFTTKEIDKKLLLEKHPELKEEGAVFVTLTLNDNLRGCMGSIIPHRSLLDDVINNAQAAAFKDPRFLPLTKDEFKNIKIEVSILTIPVELEYKDKEDLKEKIEPNKDGVILKSGTHQATYLPQVWEELPTFELFFKYLCQKAGLNDSNCLETHPIILTYQVEKIES